MLPSIRLMERPSFRVSTCMRFPDTAWTCCCKVVRKIDQSLETRLQAALCVIEILLNRFSGSIFQIDSHSHESAADTL